MFAQSPRRRVAFVVAAAAVVAGAGSAVDVGAIGEGAPSCAGLESLGRVNNAPLGVDDEVWTAPDTEVVVDVLANDTDFDGDDIVVVEVLPAGRGAATLDDGQVGYSPGLGFEGDDTFVYVVSDGGCGTSRATVRVLVSVDPPPVDKATPEPPVTGVVTFTG